MIKEAFKLPKTRHSEYDSENMEDILDEIQRSDAVFTMYKKGSEYKCLFTDLGITEFSLPLILLDRHIELFNFFKMAVITTEKLRSGELAPMDVEIKAIEYFRKKRREQFNSETIL